MARAAGRAPPAYAGEEYERSVSAFRRFDANGDGIISREELSHAFVAMDPEFWDHERVSQLMDLVDTNRDGRIKYEEFLAWLMGDSEDWDVDRHAAQLKGVREIKKEGLVQDSRETASATEPIDLQFDQSSGSKVGIKVDGSGGKALVIKAVLPGGMLAAWNSRSSARQVSTGDSIVEVNGIRNDATKLMKELKKKLLMDIVVEPRRSAKGYLTKISDVYKVDKGFIEDGAFSCIRTATHWETKAVFAVNSVHKKRTGREDFEAMVELMKGLDHPNVIKIYEVFEDCLDFHLVLEHCRGGELLERLLSDSSFTEMQAVRVMTQVLEGLTYLHTRQVCHRDVRPEHVLLVNKRPIGEATIKLVDFRAARRFGPGIEAFHTVAAPALYAAPEVLGRAGYGQACDLWACGVMLYLALSGYPPFAGATEAETLGLVRRGTVQFPSDWSNISWAAKDLVQRLLCNDPQERCTGPQALAHNWIQNSDTAGKDFRIHEYQERMRAFRGQSRLKKAALHAIAQRLHDGEIRKLQEMFSLLDKNGDKTVTFYELKAGLDKLGQSESLDDLQVLMEEVDVDGSRRIDYTEFLAATLDKRRYIEDDACWAAFQVFDRDRNGRIGMQELQQVLEDGDLQAVMGGEAVASVLKRCDVNRDGYIDFDEFMVMMRQEGPSEFEEL